MTEPEDKENTQMETEEVETTTAEQTREPETVTVSDIELESLRRDSQDYKEKYLRVLAESENARKRLQKEREEMIQYSLRNMVCDFLPPIDQMENALKHADNASEEVKQWSVGFQMILNHFRDVLTNNGVQAFDSLGQAFDPHMHEAIESVPSSDHPAGIVVEEALRGYKMGDRVIRPARVKVSKEPAQEKTEKEKKD